MNTPWTQKISRPTKNEMVRRLNTACRTYMESHFERQVVCEKHVERGSSLGREKHPD